MLYEFVSNVNPEPTMYLRFPLFTTVVPVDLHELERNKLPGIESFFGSPGSTAFTTRMSYVIGVLKGRTDKFKPTLYPNCFSCCLSERNKF